MAEKKKTIKDYSPEEIAKALKALKGKPLPTEGLMIQVYPSPRPGRFREADEEDSTFPTNT